MADFAELIARLEKATGPCSDLDEDIALASGMWHAWLSKHRYWNFNYKGLGEVKEWNAKPNDFSWPEGGFPKFDQDTGEEIKLTETPCHGWGYNAQLPQFSSSIDAALTLVDKEWFWRLCNDGEGADPASFRADILCTYTKHQGWSDIPAIALCIAALRARSTP